MKIVKNKVVFVKVENGKTLFFKKTLSIGLGILHTDNISDSLMFSSKKEAIDFKVAVNLPELDPFSPVDVVITYNLDNV